MIGKLAELRVLATFRRIAKAMEEANRLELHRQEMEYPPTRTTPAPNKAVVISHPSVDAWNERASGGKS